jgi:hypothetical protein
MLAGRAVEEKGPFSPMSPALIKLRISEHFRKAKEQWHDDPADRDDGDPAAATQEVLFGQSEKRHRLYGGLDSIRPLAVGGLPQDEEDR